MGEGTDASHLDSTVMSHAKGAVMIREAELTASLSSVRQVRVPGRVHRGDHYQGLIIGVEAGAG